jgi:hypothetical protein
VSVLQGRGANIKVIVPNAKVDVKTAKLVQQSAATLKVSNKVSPTTGCMITRVVQGWDRYPELPTLLEFASVYFNSLPKHLLKTLPIEPDVPERSKSKSKGMHMQECQSTTDFTNTLFPGSDQKDDHKSLKRPYSPPPEEIREGGDRGDNIYGSNSCHTFSFYVEY